ncbi:jg7230 [Pararge aegeria aegeria]|uniref:Jg7230 protein n=1 Tax=Pararge aegeria aegeria TaxID=348720 RepID=A0A8S4SAN7_9NEOP|nr:jg7230 [Pararge aegeria aegeria]
MSTTTAQVLMKKGKRGAAAYIHADCVSGYPQYLGPLLDVLLNPGKAIDEWETIDWCRWLLAGGRTPDEFAAIGKYREETFTSESFPKDQEMLNLPIHTLPHDYSLSPSHTSFREQNLGLVMGVHIDTLNSDLADEEGLRRKPVQTKAN